MSHQVICPQEKVVPEPAPKSALGHVFTFITGTLRTALAMGIWLATALFLLTTFGKYVPYFDNKSLAMGVVAVGLLYHVARHYHKQDQAVTDGIVTSWFVKILPVVIIAVGLLWLQGQVAVTTYQAKEEACSYYAYSDSPEECAAMKDIERNLSKLRARAFGF